MAAIYNSNQLLITSFFFFFPISLGLLIVGTNFLGPPFTEDIVILDKLCAIYVLRLMGVLFIVTGISYLSRAQESAARVRIGNPTPIPHVVKSSSKPSVADAVFIERIKSRVKYWRNACKDTSSKTDGKDNAATIIISVCSNS